MVGDTVDADKYKYSVRSADSDCRRGQQVKEGLVVGLDGVRCDQVVMSPRKACAPEERRLVRLELDWYCGERPAPWEHET